MTKPTETLQRIPLAKLWLADENARKDSKELGDIEALRGSLLALNRVIDPLHVYPDGDEFKVWDGRRRLAALKGIQKKALTPELASPPVLVCEDKEAAMMLSAATFVREAMHPADEFLHYKRLFEAGLDHERIAAACAVPTPRVRQLLRMVGVAPEIVDALRAGELALDVVEAFTLSADHAKQLSVLEAVRQRSKSPTAWMVKDAFRAEAVGPKDRWAVLVGREAYEAAGGTFLSDLFSRGEEDEEWADGNLVKSLAQQQINAMIAELEADGWSFVEFITYDRAHHAWQKGHQQSKGPWSDAVKAKGGVFIVQDWNGKLDVKKGWVKPSKEEREGADPLPGEKPDPALYGWGHKGHGVLTQVATEATKVALIRNPDAAYDALLTHIAWVALAEYSTESTASKLISDGQRWGAPNVEVEGAGEVDAAREAWRARFSPFLKASYNTKPEDRTGFCDAVAALSAEEKAALMAYCFATSLWAFEDKNNARRPNRWAHLGWIARRAGADLVKAWRPDAEFLKGGSKDALLDAVLDLGNTGTWASAPKKEMAATVAAQAKDRGWLPKLLRDLVAAPAAPAADVPAKAKRQRPPGFLSAPKVRKAIEVLANAADTPPPTDQDEGEAMPDSLRRLAGPGAPVEADADVGG